MQPSRKVILKLPGLNPRLRDFIDDQTRFCIAATGTKVGKTVACSIWVVKNAWNNPGSKWWWIGPVMRQARIGYENMKKLLPAEYIKPRDSELVLALANGSVIEAKSADNPDSLFGEAVSGVVIDEAARIKEDAFHAIRTTVSATNGKMKIISNPKGRNWFYRLYMSGLDPLNNDFCSYTLSTYDSPYVRLADIEDAKSMLPENVFKELYLGAFLEDSGHVFRNVKTCVAGKLEDAQAGRKYVIGADIAKYTDFTVLCAVDVESRRLVGWERFNKIDWTLQKRRVMQMSKKYNNAHVLIDSTGVGDPILEDLVRAGIPVSGYRFTNTSKQQLIEALVVVIEKQDIMFPDISELICELNMFDYEVNRNGNIIYGASSGFHDDCVISLALANWALGNKAAIEFLSTGKKNSSARYQG